MCAARVRPYYRKEFVRKLKTLKLDNSSFEKLDFLRGLYPEPESMLAGGLDIIDCIGLLLYNKNRPKQVE